MADPLLTIRDTPEAAMHAAADAAVDHLLEILGERDTAFVALTGGSTAPLLYRQLAERHATSLDWDRIHFFLGDERVVPLDDEDSNYRQAEETLLDPLGVPENKRHPFPTEAGPPEQVARGYEAVLRRVCGEGLPVLDLVLLGLGGDGHVASLFPGHESLEERTRWVIPTEAPDELAVKQRVTLTFPVLNAARAQYLLVAGASKRGAVQATLGDTLPTGWSERPPAARLDPAGPLCWFLDQAAAGDLG